MVYDDIGIVVLAAGKGTRMKSDLPKVLHCIHGKPMITCVLQRAVSVCGKNIVVVIGYQAEKVKAEVSKEFDVHYAIQHQLLGTGDAVRTALPVLSNRIRTVLVLCGDVPLITDKTLHSLIEVHKKQENAVTVLTVTLDNPTGYGRIILDEKGQLASIKEEADATVQEKNIKHVNAGIYCIDRDFLSKGLEALKPDNVQKEIYLTDIIGVARLNQVRLNFMKTENPVEVTGINTLAELENVEKLMPSTVL